MHSSGFLAILKLNHELLPNLAKIALERNTINGGNVMLSKRLFDDTLMHLFTEKCEIKQPGIFTLRCGIVDLQNRSEFANPIAASNIHMRYRLYSV